MDHPTPPVDTNDMQALYTYTMQRLNVKCAELYEKYKSHLACQQGCFDCCKDNFKIRYVEALGLLHALTQLPAATQHIIFTQLQQPATGKCPMLINGACSVYDNRPALCRAYGLILKVNDKIATCKLNFLDPPESPQLLDMGPFYQLLDEISLRLWQQFHPKFAKLEPAKLTIREYLLELLELSRQPLEPDCLN